MTLSSPMPRRHGPATLIAAAALLAFSLAPRPGHAQGGANAAAQALFDEGKALMAAGKASEACPRFEESQRIDPGSGTLINLALCYEKTGRIASAWSAYSDAAAAARISGNVDRERYAREHAATLAPKVSKLTVTVPEDSRVPGLVVTRDGLELGTVQWGLAIPADSGTHELVAKAPGYETWQTKVEVAAKATTATVTVPKLVAAPEPVAAAPVATVAAEPPPEPPPPAPAEGAQSSGLGGQRIAALVVGGVGVAGIAVGSIFGVQAMKKKKTVDNDCDGSVCETNTGVTAGEDGYSAARISTISMIAGGACLAGGVVLWLTAPKKSASVGLGPTGIVLRRNF